MRSVITDHSLKCVNEWMLLWVEGRLIWPPGSGPVSTIRPKPNAAKVLVFAESDSYQLAQFFGQCVPFSHTQSVCDKVLSIVRLTSVRGGTAAASLIAVSL